MLSVSMRQIASSLTQGFGTNKVRKVGGNDGIARCISVMIDQNLIVVGRSKSECKVSARSVQGECKVSARSVQGECKVSAVEEVSENNKLNFVHFSSIAPKRREEKRREDNNSTLEDKIYSSGGMTHQPNQHGEKTECPYVKIFDLWNQICCPPNCSVIPHQMGPARKLALDELWAKNACLDFWKNWMQAYQDSFWCKKPSEIGKPTNPDFDRLIKSPDILNRLIEGRYRYDPNQNFKNSKSNAKFKGPSKSLSHAYDFFQRSTADDPSNGFVDFAKSLITGFINVDAIKVLEIASNDWRDLYDEVGLSLEEAEIAIHYMTDTHLHEAVEERQNIGKLKEEDIKS
jgi:hypothetical protein